MTPSSKEYRLIPLTQGQFARVSPHRFEELNRFSWHAWWCPTTKSFYAARTSCEGSVKQAVYMHRSILGLNRGDKRWGDHIDHDTLNDLDDNLRISEPRQNIRNSRVRSDNVSGYKGVSWEARCGRWIAQIQVDGRHIYLGRRLTAEQAYHELYIPAAIKHFGEYACLG